MQVSTILYFLFLRLSRTIRFCFLAVDKFTQMSVWTHYVYWDGEYRKGPDNIVCRRSQQKKREETAAVHQQFSSALAREDQF